MKELQTIQNFIEYNEPIFNEIKEENNDLSSAISLVLRELTSKYTGITFDTPKPQIYADALFSVGDEVTTSTRDFNGVGIIKGYLQQYGKYLYQVKALDKLYNIEEEHLLLVQKPIDTPKPTKQKPTKRTDSLYDVGDAVTTNSGASFEGVGYIESFFFDKDSNQWSYKIKNNNSIFVELEENLMLSQTIDNTDYSSLTFKQLQDELDMQNEIISIFDDPEDPENIEAKDKILEITMLMEKMSTL
jgi:hypothetical protein